MAEEKTIWDAIKMEVKNPYGTAALMGNLFAESSLDPCKCTGSLLISKNEYIMLINDGDISADVFSKDGVAFGLAQWRYWSRKEKLYYEWRKYRKTHPGISIGDLGFQLDFLLREIQTYKTVWNTMKETKSIKEASDVILEKYEKPANISDKIKEKRAGFGQKYYDQFELGPQPTPEGIWVRTTKERVNVRKGNGKNYPIIGQIAVKGTRFPWVATADNNWHAIDMLANATKINAVGWVSGEFSEVYRE